MTEPDDGVVRGARPGHQVALGTASLGEAPRDAAPSYDKACQAVAIDGDD